MSEVYAGQQPLISVLMTAYNRGKYIAEAIESVQGSTWQNFELIIVDDVSQDDTYSIALQYAERDSRIRVYKNDTNLGDYPNRNMAASYATGKYLKYLDADDKLYPYGLEIMIRSMEDHPAAQWGLMSIPQDDDRQFPLLLQPVEIYRRHYFNSNRSVNYPHLFYKAPLSSIIKKEAFDEVGGFKDVRHYGDSDLWQRLAMHYPVLIMQDGLVWWRGGDSSQESSKRKKKLHLPIVTINNFIENILHKDCPLSDKEKKEAVAICRMRADRIILHHIKHGRLNVAYQLFKLKK